MIQNYIMLIQTRATFYAPVKPIKQAPTNLDFSLIQRSRLHKIFNKLNVYILTEQTPGHARKQGRSPSVFVLLRVEKMNYKEDMAKSLDGKPY